MPNRYLDISKLLYVGVMAHELMSHQGIPLQQMHVNGAPSRNITIQGNNI